MPKVTIEDIARKAGVSKTSVSFAFNNPERLSEATLKHILGVAEELGYNPDPIASNLKTGRTGCIGLLMPQPIPNVARNPHTLEFIEGIGEICHDAGTSLMLVPPPGAMAAMSSMMAFRSVVNFSISWGFSVKENTAT